MDMLFNRRAVSIFESTTSPMKNTDDRKRHGRPYASWARAACLVLVASLCGCRCPDSPKTCPEPPTPETMTDKEIAHGWDLGGYDGAESVGGPCKNGTHREECLVTVTQNGFP